MDTFHIVLICEFFFCNKICVSGQWY